MRLVPPDKLGWRPSDSNNWMTLGQLLDHLAEPTGVPMRGFITGQWPSVSEGEVLPPAGKMPSAASVDEALKRLEADRQLTLTLLGELSQDEFRNRTVVAPWDPTPQPLWCQLLLMVEHQINHKAMLFAYLKMLGAPVNTAHLYGMA